MRNKVTKQDIDKLVSECEFAVYHRVFGKQCIMIAMLPSGFTVVGTSAVVDPVNYVEEMGESIALKVIENKIWELEGYALQKQLSEATYTDGWAE